VNVSKAFVITRRFIGSVGTGSGTAKCKHCLDVNTHTRHVILSGIHCEIYKKRLIKPPALNAGEYAEECIYVILAGGFRQKIAKKKFGEIMNFIHSGGEISEKN